MGVRPRQRPKRLAEKLGAIRAALGLSQAQLVKHLGAEEMIVPGQISEFESDKREPSLPVLLRYARAAGICVDVLIDDDLDLPDELPGTADHEEIKRKFASRSKRAGKKTAR
jgi:transcriptional regulator with XRE-family HTH domain